MQNSTLNNLVTTCTFALPLRPARNWNAWHPLFPWLVSAYKAEFWPAPPVASRGTAANHRLSVTSPPNAPRCLEASVSWFLCIDFTLAIDRWHSLLGYLSMQWILSCQEKQRWDNIIKPTYIIPIPADRKQWTKFSGFIKLPKPWLYAVLMWSPGHGAFRLSSRYIPLIYPW